VSPSRQRISLALIARNEERSIQQALLSARPFVQEIIVVDTGSSDRTIELAKRSGAAVSSIQWSDDFAAARNAALEACTGDWVLSMDADEVLTASSGRLLADMISRGPAAYVPLIDWKGRGLSFGYARLFPREGAHWKFRIYEEVEHDPPIERIPAPDFRILHNPQNQEGSRADLKREQYGRMARLLAAEHPGDPYATFRAAQTIFSLDQGDSQALDILEPVLGLIPRNASYGPDAFYIAIRGNRIAGKLEQGIDAYERAKLTGHGKLAHQVEYAELLHLAGRDAEALVVIRAIQDLTWDGYMDEGYYRARLEELLEEM
jgi:hypothetical protein